MAGGMGGNTSLVVGQGAPHRLSAPRMQVRDVSGLFTLGLLAARDFAND
jgi:hypothetical protein